MRTKIVILYVLLFAFLISCQEKATNVDSEILTDSVFTAGIEGPAWKNDTIYLVNYKSEGTIGCIDAKGNVQQFIQLPNGSIGNGIRFNSKGQMMIADYSGHNILMVDMPSKAITVYAHDTMMNQPNDLTILKNDIIYCSDPKWADNSGKLWRINTDGSTTLLEDSMGTTNGIEVSPDQKYLYVNESIQRKVWRYTILNEKGDVGDKKEFYSFTTAGMDGMKCDADGNLWIARYDDGKVVVLSPTGKLIRAYRLQGQKPTNLTFGRPGDKSCYVTMQDMRWVEKIRMD